MYKKYLKKIERENNIEIYLDNVRRQSIWDH
jgi:hypothetical protein